MAEEDLISLSHLWSGPAKNGFDLRASLTVSLFLKSVFCFYMVQSLAARVADDKKWEQPTDLLFARAILDRFASAYAEHDITIPGLIPTEDVFASLSRPTPEDLKKVS